MPDFQVPTEATEVNKRKIFYIAIPLVVLIAVNIVLFLALRNIQSTIKKPEEEITLPGGQKFYKLKNTELEVKTPWISSENPIVAASKDPSISELDSNYKNVRNAFLNRDYSLFEANASSRIIWIYSVNAVFSGIIQDGKMVSETGALRGKEYFENQAPARRLETIPLDSNLLQPQYLESLDLQQDEDFVMEDISSGDEYFVRDQKWGSAVKLYYKIGDPKNNYIQSVNDKYDGYVVFVFDGGSWKYYAELWSVKPVEGSTLGDTRSGGKSTSVKKIGEGFEYSPSEVTISQGDKVRWENITGVIFSTNTKVSNWHTPFLLNQSYEKLFPAKGTYDYLIVRHDQSFSGKVIVN